MTKRTNRARDMREARRRHTLAPPSRAERSPALEGEAQYRGQRGRGGGDADAWLGRGTRFSGGLELPIVSWAALQRVRRGRRRKVGRCSKLAETDGLQRGRPAKRAKKPAEDGANGGRWRLQMEQQVVGVIATLDIACCYWVWRTMQATRGVRWVGSGGQKPCWR